MLLNINANDSFSLISYTLTYVKVIMKELIFLISSDASFLNLCLFNFCLIIQFISFYCSMNL